MIALFFDTETTGIKTWDNPDFFVELVQLGLILQDMESGRVLAEVNLINAIKNPIPKPASDVHGITNEFADMAGIHIDLIDAVFARLAKKADLIVAHNIAYDLDVIAENMPVSHKVLQDKQMFCTMIGNIYVVQAPLSEKQKNYFMRSGKLPEAPFKVPNLTETHVHYFNVPFEGAHDAMADIRACRSIFVEMTDKHKYWKWDSGSMAETSKLKKLMAAAPKL